MRVLQTRAQTREATVSSYDPATGAVKVLYQPEGVQSGWLPLGAMGVGNGIGMLFAPNIGDQVSVHPIDGSHGTAVVGPRLFSDKARPPGVPAGEFWVVQQAGSFLKMQTSGVVTLSAAGGAVAVLDGASVTITASDVSTSGNLRAGSGASGSFTTPTGQVVTVQDGIIINIY